MASISRTDIMQKKFSKGRPANSEERINRRQEAYKWRDARRVYLASSFDRWRKLRSSMKLKDGSLAWHLMEAHKKGSCHICRKLDPPVSLGSRAKCSPEEFLPSLVALVRQLCHAHFDFEESIEVVGLLCLEFDHKRKENFSINEHIKSGMKPTLPSYSLETLNDRSSLSNQTDTNVMELDIQVKGNAEHDKTVADDVQPTNCNLFRVTNHCSDLTFKKLLNRKDESASHLELKFATQKFDHINEGSGDTSYCSKLNCLLGDCNSSAGNADYGSAQLSKKSRESEDFQFQDDCNTAEESEHLIRIPTDGFEKGKEKKTVLDSCLYPESDVSLEIDIEKMDTSEEHENCQDIQQQLMVDVNVSEICDTNSPKTPPTKAKYSPPKREALSCCQQPREAEKSSKFKTESKCHNVSEPFSSDAKSSASYHNLITPNETKNAELPLDMSVLKSTFKQEWRQEQISESVKREDTRGSPSRKEKEGGHFDLVNCTLSSGKKRMSEAGYDLNKINKIHIVHDMFQGKTGRHREEIHASIPWQRRDMSRKEEYEFLEFNPFCDLAEFSQRYPHVHQRTYYRWKRRIKEEYIILEQCPEMTFQEFSSVILQAKESVFHLWKSLVAQGKGFFAPSDTSKRLETKCLPKPSTHHNKEHVFMQKNLSLTFEQFSQQYPGIPAEVYNMLKRKVMHEFWLFYQNQHMTYNDFSKLVNVTEDVFSMWKEHIEYLRLNSLSPNLKAAPSNVSLSPQISLSPFQPLGSPKSSSTDLSTQPPKDTLFGLMNSNPALKESLAAVHSGALNPGLNESIARTISASYLASLQNMMLPWHNYYGMASPLGHQMLPMMLWPGMMGLQGGMTSPLDLVAESQEASVQTPSVAPGFVPISVKDNVDRNELTNLESFNEEYCQKSQSGSQHGTKRMPCDNDNHNQSKLYLQADCEKKLKLCSERDGQEIWGSVSRARKQNKQEYEYYLKNPELGFKELESLFPSISLRTFYRWRKEMNAAVLLLEDNKDMTFTQFQVVFPDIPEEIYDMWKTRSSNEVSALIHKKEQLPLAVDFDSTNKESRNNSVGHSEQFTGEFRNMKEQGYSINIATNNLQQPSSGDDTLYHRKCNKEEYLYVQKNPDADFATFSKMYPNTSVRSFYRWKRELKDAVDYLRANPAVDFEAYMVLDATISEEVFNVWKSYVHSEQFFGEDSENSASQTIEDKSAVHSNRKLNGPEYWFLQLNPYIEFSQFARTYPDVPKRTFYRWKREIQQIISYIRVQRSVEYSDISAILPEVSKDAFQRWKKIIDGEHGNPMETKDPVNTEECDTTSYTKLDLDEQTKDQMTKALLHLMHNPTTDYINFRSEFDFVSTATFELWLNRIKTVILHIASNPKIDYTAFSTSIKDVGEDIFEKWKSLGPAEIAALDLVCEEARQMKDEIESDGHSEGQTESHNDENIYQKAYEFCQKNPEATTQELLSQFPKVSKELFQSWMSKVRSRVNFLRKNPDIAFGEFAEVFPHTKREVFDQWKCKASKSNHLLHFLQKPSVEEDLYHRSDSESKASQEHYKAQSPETSKNNSVLASREIVEKSPKRRRESPFPATGETFDRYNAGIIINDPKESCLRKLTKFADSSSQSQVNQDSVCRATEFLNDKQIAPLSHPSVEQLYGVNNNSQQIPSSPKAMENFLNVANAPTTNPLYSKKSTTPHMNSTELYKVNLLSSPDCNSSLSALMAMSRNEMTLKGGLQSVPKKDLPGPPLPSCPGNSQWLGANSGNVKEDDEAFSSQRQKKMSRAEYMFVKENPEIDSQEFSRIFPGVSARTFYRWKKEIKAQLHLD